MEGLARVPEGRVLTVQYHDLLAHPQEEIASVVDFLELRVRPEQRARVGQLIDPTRAIQRALREEPAPTTARIPYSVEPAVPLPSRSECS